MQINSMQENKYFSMHARVSTLQEQVDLGNQAEDDGHLHWGSRVRPALA